MGTKLYQWDHSSKYSASDTCPKDKGQVSLMQCCAPTERPGNEVHACLKIGKVMRTSLRMTLSAENVFRLCKADLHTHDQGNDIAVSFGL